ncbi:TGF-beta receptor type-1 [Geodia barretti]|nr:TGF-beta receptor type-1 [Geodia barretti]
METDESTGSSGGDTLETIAIVSGVIASFFIIIAASVSLSFFYCYCCHRRSDRERTEDMGECGDSSPSPVASIGPVAFQPQGISLGKLSTHPFPSLQQRHIVQHTSLQKNLEKGRFCDTYIGVWRRDQVLVKVFSEKAERIWFNESRIHQLQHMRHENVHCFYATDNPDSSSHHFIVLEYHRHGSLYEYLQKTTLHSYNVVTFAMAIADGLAFLHSDLSDELGRKPSIAHRNISSESIYVTANGSCCISDFSLAVTSADNPADLSSTTTPNPDYRYLAPEFLASPPATPTLETLKKGDIYSYGLVLWEIARRCSVLGMVESVCLPYSTVLQQTPVQRDEMRDIVITRDLRPPVPDQWNRDETMRIILRTITECWHGNSTVRLTPQRVKKTLWKLSQHIQPKMYDKNGKLLTIERNRPLSESPVQMV